MFDNDRKPDDADANASNAFPNVYGVRGRQDDILEYLENLGQEAIGINIARDLKMPSGTVRWALQQLKKQGKILDRKLGKYTFWCASKSYDDQLLRMMKKHDTGQKWSVHGLTLFTTGDFKNLLKLANASIPGIRTVFGGVEVGYGRGGLRWGVVRGGGRLSFQLGEGSLTVKGAFSSCPLDYDGFVLLLGFLDGHLKALGLPGVEGRLNDWAVLQYGLNRDGLVSQFDGGESVTLYAFDGWLARCYAKEVLGVRREEIHGSEPVKMERFLAMVGGGLTTTQVMNFLDMFALRVNDLTKSNRELFRSNQVLQASNRELHKSNAELARSVETLRKSSELLYRRVEELGRSAA